MNEWIARIASVSTDLNPMDPGYPSVLRRLPGIRCVLFDVYGTLFISGSGDIGTVDMASRSQAAADACRSVCTAAGEIIQNDRDALVRHIRQAHDKARAVGVEYPEIDIRDIWRAVFREHGIEGLSQEAIERIALEYELAQNPVWPMPGFMTTLSALGARSLRMGIVSNAQFFTPLLFPALSGKTLEQLGFDPTLCVWSWKEEEAKPSRKLFQLVLTQLAERGVQPDEVVYVGNDMLNDIWPAAKAGCRTALFAGDARSLRLRHGDPRVQSTRPDVVIQNLSQLLECVTEADRSYT